MHTGNLFTSHSALMRAVICVARALALPAALLVVWHIATACALVNPIILPPPGAVARAGARLLCQPLLWHNLLASLYRALLGFSGALAVAVPVGLWLGQCRRAYRFSEFSIDFARSIPATALFPLFMLAFGVGDMSKMAIVMFSCFFVILISTIYGVWNAPTTRITMAQTLRATRLQMFTKVLFFDALPEIFGGLRNAISIALILVIVSEMFIGTKTGLGFLIFNAKIAYDTPVMYALIVILGLLGYALNRALLLVEIKTIFWTR